MFTVQTVRFTVKPHHTEHFAEAVKQIVEALQSGSFQGVRYSMCKSGDAATFFGVLRLRDGVENPLPGLKAGQAFLAGLERWTAAPPEREQWVQLAEFDSIGHGGGE